MALRDPDQLRARPQLMLRSYDIKCPIKSQLLHQTLHFVADAFAGELTPGSFKTIPASEETTNTQRFEADSLAGLDV
jgi:hypothetical protein